MWGRKEEGRGTMRNRTDVKTRSWNGHPAEACALFQRTAENVFKVFKESESRFNRMLKCFLPDKRDWGKEKINPGCNFVSIEYFYNFKTLCKVTLSITQSFIHSFILCMCHNSFSMIRHLIHHRKTAVSCWKANRKAGTEENILIKLRKRGHVWKRSCWLIVWMLKDVRFTCFSWRMISKWQRWVWSQCHLGLLWQFLRTRDAGLKGEFKVTQRTGRSVVCL